MNFLKSIVLSMFVCSGALAKCNDMFLNQHLPNVSYDKELCYREYTVLYNYQYKIPMISAEHLTVDNVKKSSTVKRHDAFHVDASIPVVSNQKISSYVNSGYDKGHMAPAGDMGSIDSSRESFSMSNMIPQATKLNRVVWRNIETEVRNDVLKNGSAYILTGSIVQTKKVMNDGIVIPDYIFKAVYFSTSRIKVYVAENNNSMNYKIISTSEFQTMYGIMLFN